LHLASSELLQDCMIEGKLSTELLNKYKIEINAFKRDLEKKYFVLLQNVETNKMGRRLLLDTFDQILVLYNRLNNSNINLDHMIMSNA